MEKQIEQFVLETKDILRDFVTSNLPFLQEKILLEKLDLVYMRNAKAIIEVKLGTY